MFVKQKQTKKRNHPLVMNRMTNAITLFSFIQKCDSESLDEQTSATLLGWQHNTPLMAYSFVAELVRR